MKISNIKTPAFQKSLVAKCQIPKNGGGFEQCSIYKLDDEEDITYFDKLDYSFPIYGRYIGNEMEIINDEDCPRNGYAFVYTMEDSKGRCIGFCETSPDSDVDDNDVLSVDILETINGDPKNKSPYRYIGESFLAYSAKLAKGKNLPRVTLCTLKSARNFYLEKCFFQQYSTDLSELRLNYENFDKLINQNEAHTGAQIEIVA